MSPRTVYNKVGDLGESRRCTRYHARHRSRAKSAAENATMQLAAGDKNIRLHIARLLST